MEAVLEHNGPLRRQIGKRVVDLLMLGLLGGTLFPIGWMIFCSLKNNNEILQGKVGLGRWENDLRAIHLGLFRR